MTSCWRQDPEPTLEKEIQAQLDRIRQILIVNGHVGAGDVVKQDAKACRGSESAKDSCIACLSSKKKCVIIVPCGHKCLCKR